MLKSWKAPIRLGLGRALLVSALVGLVFGAACSSSDFSQEDLDAAKDLAVAKGDLANISGDLTAATSDLNAANSELSAAASDLTAAESQLATTKSSLDTAQGQISDLQVQVTSMGAIPPPITVIQTGQSVPADPGSAPTGWANDESVRGGLYLVAQYDSSGPDAWDPVAHPLVYYSSDGTESDSPTYDADADYFAGFYMVDGYSKDVIGSVIFTELEGMKVSSYPHGVGVSPDGKWIYVGFGMGDDREGHLAIVNARTLKIDKLLKQESYFEGGMRSQRVHHIQGWIDSSGEDKVIVQWGFGANGGPHHILDPNDDNRVYKALTYDDIKPMGHPFTTPSPNGQYVYVSMGANFIRSNHSPAAAIAKWDIETGKHVVIEGVGHHPIGITHTADGRWTYVIDGHSSFVYKIDNEIDEVVASTSTGVAGPYGIALNWDETRAFIVAKGEGTHNKGAVLGVVDLERFRAARDLRQMPIWLGGSASSVDHAILHPDPEVNELWVSNMNGWETIVLDIDTYTAVDWIATPAGGNTHSGAFVSYTSSWAGTLEADMGGPKSPEMWTVVQAKVAAAAQ
jgi:DNA-binding beta-propeller fold protein YncE